MENLTNQPHFKPTSQKSRINSLDVIRGIALLGILLMNINGMGLPFSYDDPTVAGGSDGLNIKVWYINELFFEGTMRGLFTLLFGAGFILLTTRLEKSGAGIKTADIYYRRIFWLLIFGLINVWILLWHGDILFPYAIFGLLLFPFRNTPIKTLIISGIILICLGSVWNISDYNNDLKIKESGVTALELKKSGTTLLEIQKNDITAWENFQKKQSPEKIKAFTEKMREGYWDVSLEKVELNHFMQTWFPYRYWVWDILSYMLIGMAFFKIKIFHGTRSTKLYLWFLIIGYGLGVTINYLEAQLILESNFDKLIMHKAAMTYQIGRLFTTMGHIGLFMLFIKSGILGFLQKALAAVGRMALTNYLMHSVITSILFYGFGFALFGTLQRYELYYIVGSIWVFQLITSPIWLKYFQYGPVEWLWRSLTYQKKQPFKIDKND
ncbi:DUF418 domain-containing protein [Hyunsoonleella aestuarii]|uniref:DUF418 domain-containing protein n=1 Tax=Hyunsoonleella aestuarii TaxID=912802 RepID=A0ABP8EEF0_9FLAO|nr:DUF418 domain-containing protein [Hyunsoonleella aestuarii]